MQLRDERRRRRLPPHLVLLIAAAACGSKGDDNAAPPAAKTVPIDAAAPKAATDEVQTFADAGAAVRAVLDQTEARVLGFGELHERTGSEVRSTLARFRTDILPVVVDRMSDLVVEIWARDACGDKSATVNANVQKTTQRPASTENDVLALMTATKQKGVQNHVLKLACGDYDAILDTEGEVDYEKLLLLVTRKLSDTTGGVVKARAGDAPAAKGRDLVAIYGGALHNNMHPYESTAAFSYAREVDRAAGDRFVEIDLYVPEFADGDELLAQEDWYPILEKRASTDEVVLIRRGPASFILILRRGQTREKN